MRRLEPSRFVPTFSFSQSLLMSQYAAATSAVFQPRHIASATPHCFSHAALSQPCRISEPKCSLAERRDQSQACVGKKNHGKSRGTFLDGSMKNHSDSAHHRTSVMQHRAEQGRQAGPAHSARRKNMLQDSEGF